MNDCCADTSTCCPRPDRARSTSPTTAATAASAAAWWNTCGSLIRTGGRSSSPVSTSWPLAAATREVRRRPRRLRTRRGRTARSTRRRAQELSVSSRSRSIGTAPHSISTSADRQRASKSTEVERHGPLAAVVRQMPQAARSSPGSSPTNGPVRRADDPSGGSTRITSAPSWPSRNPARWPRSSVRSSTRYGDSTAPPN